MKPFITPQRVASLVALTTGICNADIKGPYTADADTVYLYHFNEAAGATSAANAGSAGFPAIAFDGDPSANNATAAQPVNTTILGAAGLTGFGTSANLSAADLGLGVDANSSGGFQMGADAAASADAILHSSLVGADGSFTMEAMINLPVAIGTSTYEILCTDNSLATRGFQFRINGSTTDKRLEFNFIGTATPAILASIPTTGLHAFAPNTWFHVALVFNGTTNDVKFYWTKVDPSVVTANEIGTPPYTETTLGTVSAPLVIGNEARATGGNSRSSEGLRGLIDEVRISKVARSASDFIFANNDTDADGLQDSWEILHFILPGEDPVANRATILARYSGTSDPDGDTYNNAAEYAAGSDPKSAASTPLDVDADGLPDSWEIEKFGNLLQTAAGDPDNDFNTNAAEYAADSDPNSNFSWPDTDVDGLNDGWEVHYFSNITSQTADDDPDHDGFTNSYEQNFLTNPTVQFSSPDTDGDGLADGWEVHFFIHPGETALDNLDTIIARYSGLDDPDGDGSNNEAEETAGSDPTNINSRPYDLDGDGLVDSWEIQYFGNITSQTGAGNADGDAFTNAQEQTAGSNPNLAASTPNDIDGNGTPNSVESRVPYAVDANTLHLWDFNGATTPVVDRVYGPSNLSLSALGGGATLANASFPGFGTALNTNVGFNTIAGAYLAATTAAAGTSDDVTTKLAGANGAFSYEAMVRIDFDPTASVPGARMQILSAEDDNGQDANRTFQFSLAPVGAQGNTDTTPRVSFTNIDADPLTAGLQPQAIEFPTPATGANAAVQGQWFHVAVTYDGNEATAGNMKFYWTRVDSTAVAANLIGSAQMNADLPVPAAVDLCIGNETRDVGGESGAFQGLIDQVRVSDIARADTAFIFGGAGNPDADNDHLPDAWEITNFGNLGQSGTDDYDHDGTNNRAEYLLNLDPKNGASLFKASVVGGTIQWQGVAGLNFVVQRSGTLANGSWSNVSTQTGVGGLNSYTDPTPPSGKAFYRVLLVMP